MYCTLVKPVDQWAGDMKLAVSSTFTEVWFQHEVVGLRAFWRDG